MSYLRLDEVCNLKMGQSPDSGSYNQERDGIPFFQGNADFGEMHPVTRTWCNNPTKVVDKGTLLISVRAPIGALNFAAEKSCIGRGLAGITAKNEYDLKYIYYALKYKNRELKDKGTGSTFKAISKSTLGKVLIRDMTIENQRECIKRLDLIYKIFVTKKEKIRQYDELIKSRFVEMFGDPTDNPLRWDKFPLGKRCNIITGNTPPRADAENYGTFIEWIKSDNINTPDTYLTPAEEYLSERGFEKCRYVEAGSVLMTCIAGSIGCIGNVAVADRRVAFNQQINAIVPVADETLYVFWLMQLSKPYIQSTINMALKGILSKGQLSILEFPFPPIPKQTDFAAFVQEIDKSKFATQKALTETQQLFDSLMQKYFG